MVVPAIRKGLFNQRMRLVQDVVAAALVGAAVSLPETHYSGKGPL